jgi:hypothetical protein
MTFDQIVTDIMDRLNLSSSVAQTRIGRAVNRKYRLVTTAIGMDLSRRATTQATVTIGVSDLVFSNTEKIISVTNRTSTPYRRLSQVTLDELRQSMPFSTSNSPSKYAESSVHADSVTITLNVIPQTAFTLYAEVQTAVSDLSGSNEPAFPESYHDVLIEGVMGDELRKMEKPQLATLAQNEFQRILSDLKMWMAKSAFLDVYQGKTAANSISAPSAGSSGATTVNGALSYTQTGLITFDRDPSAPFAVVAGSAVVPNLNADLLDGSDWNTANVLPEGGLSTTDVTTNNVSSTKHGFAPKSPADTTKFLNGAASPGYAQVKDSDLSTTDITTNNVVSTKHGFAPKSPADATQFLNGAATPGYAAVKDSDLAFTDITTNNVSTTKHGFVPKAPNSNTQFLDGTGAFSTSGQIPFPAAQNASSNVNTLDDYEEGAWTPAIASSGGGAATYTAQVGKYIKVGKLTFATGTIILATKGTLAAGTVTITGLPFTAENTTNQNAAVPFINWTLTTSVVYLGGLILPNTTTIALEHLTAAAASLTLTTVADLSATSNLTFTAIYCASA